ncbi:hypothetical protein ZWY2020_006423 [Hordeum vulgare]|nr:hypothetical protein ZWY2020_006423 [Hordeum vulgare]
MGEAVTCSPTKDAELFSVVLGGLGQFGIITRARILLQEAPQKVCEVGEGLHDDFGTFTKDQELLVSMPDMVDHVEGFIVLNEQSLHSSSIAFPANMDFNPDFGTKASPKIYYCVEFAVHDYQRKNTNVEQVVEVISADEPHSVPPVQCGGVLLDFLNRVRMEEMSLRSSGLWEVHHPWLNIDKWGTNTSVVLPDSGSTEQVMYVVGILRSASPDEGCSHHCLQELLHRHRHIADTAGVRIGAKQYLAHHPSPAGWQQHFGPRWERFAERKNRFDPMSILGPGQGIFPKGNTGVYAS